MKVNNCSYRFQCQILPFFKARQLKPRLRWGEGRFPKRLSLLRLQFTYIVYRLLVPKQNSIIEIGRVFVDLCTSHNRQQFARNNSRYPAGAIHVVCKPDVMRLSVIKSHVLHVINQT